ncbi:radical SAM protein [Saccharopolyspora sp. 5N708]|uniref:radical SAM protein n=1 Tax=Saccharopolyspora sp. 5N708 TaxID=3457424 RepID=UPI003FD059BE
MPVDRRIKQLALELTERCQLSCVHCYADSSPRGGHGAMTGLDWRRVLDDAVEIGVEEVQFIGGEPTLHPECAGLVEYALAAELRVEVFTNLAHVSRSWWSLFRRPGVSVATSYYTDDAASHDAITGQRGSHARTRANIAEAVRRGVRLRGRVVDMGEADAARADLEMLGVTDIRVGPVQDIGRAAREQPPTTADLCGRCGQGRAAVNSRGDVLPCVMARWIRLGNVRRTGLQDVLAGRRGAKTVAALRAGFNRRGRRDDTCRPGK